MKPPKEKAEELVRLFKPLCKDVKHIGIINGLATVMNDDLINHMAAKQCALIAVDELIDSIEIGFEDYKSVAKNNYWQEVKTKLENL